MYVKQKPVTSEKLTFHLAIIMTFLSTIIIWEDFVCSAHVILKMENHYRHQYFILIMTDRKLLLSKSGNVPIYISMNFQDMMETQ